MSVLNWPNVSGTYLSANVATLAGMGTGDYTIIGLLRPPSGFTAILGLRDGSGYVRQIISDSGLWFGSGDFTGFGSTSTNDWMIVAQSKVAGSNLYHWQLWNYSTGTLIARGDESSGLHGDPGSVLAAWIGQGDNRGNGPIAVVGAWKRVVSHAEFDTLCTTHTLAAWMALNPDALWPLNVAKASVVDVTGHGNDVTSVVDPSSGITLTATEPPGFDFSLGVAIQDGSGGAGTAGQTDGRALGDASGSSGSAGTLDGLALGDTSGGAGTASSSDGVALGDASGGTGAGGTADGRALGDGSGGSGTGGSPDTLPGVPVVIQDGSGGVGAAGSPDAISQVVHDMLVMPVLLSAMACLQGETTNKITNPPAIFTIRPGDSFEPSADPWIVECCAGVGWVRQVSSYETDVDTFPDPLTRPVSTGCPPDSVAVVVEIGISRCFPVAGDSRGSVVTIEQWMTASQQQADDGAALRRVLCCIRDLYDNSDVASGQVNPLPIQGGCGGVSATVTIRRNACDC